MSARPIDKKIKRLRQRKRRDGNWRIWWEPEGDVRKLGFETVELDPKRITWSVREAERLNRQVESARSTGRRIETAKGGRTVSALIHRFRKDDWFNDCRPATRKSYGSLLNTIETKWGPDNVADFTKPAMREWQTSLAAVHSPRNTQAIMQMMRRLFEFAEVIGWRPENSNPCKGLKAKTPKPRDRVLTWDESDHLAATADRMGWRAVGTAILVSLLQAQRGTDILTAAPGDFTLRDVRDPRSGEELRLWTWSLKQSKRDKIVAMALHPDIVDRVRRTIAQLPPDAPYLLVDEATGRPYANPKRPGQFDLFQKRFARIREEAAKTMPSLEDIQFRDLRRTQATRAREGGVSRDDAGDLLGNTAARDFTLGDVYMGPQFWTATRAVFAPKRPGKKGQSS